MIVLEVLGRRYVVTVRESETPFWLGIVRVSAREIVEPAEIKLKPLIWRLG